MALVAGCKHALEITVPVEDIDHETERIVADLQKKVRLPGFRPGKAPANLVRTKFASEIRQDVLESIVPKAFNKQVEADHLQIVGQPNVSEVHFNKGEPLRFKAEFEVAPEFELGEYKGLTVAYEEPVVSAEDIDKRIEEIREQKAEYINIDPRPIEAGDYAVVSLKSVSGVDKPVEQDEIVLHVGDGETLPAFTENLTGLTPGDEKEFDVVYPEDYGKDELAGKTIRFMAKVKGIRRKEVPEVNDEFAQDLGDFKTVDELREMVRKGLFQQREYDTQQEAKSLLVDKLVETHDFPVPEAFVERQIRNTLEQRLRALVDQGIDPASLNLDWVKLKESQRDKAVKDVRASLLLDKIAERESIFATNDEVDREVQQFAKRQREPMAAARMKFEKDGTLGRIAAHIRTEKTLNHLFEQARKEAK